MNTNKVWFVTGASKGLGLTLVKRLLAEGYKVAATSRNNNSLIAAVGAASDNFLPLEVMLDNNESVKNALMTTVAKFNSIDVVVNNAGYGLMGTLEELSDEEAKRNFEVNVFGTLNVIRNAMPYLRAQKSGHIFNIASIGGFSGNFAGWGIYCATKFAVAGLTESLAAEVKAFGVKVTLVYPGYFRTNFLAKDSVAVPAHPIAAYEDARQSQALHEHELNGQQQGDPEKAIAALIAMSKEDHPALHLFLGQDAYDMAYQKMEAVKQDLEQWKQQTISTGF